MIVLFLVQINIQATYFNVKHIVYNAKQKNLGSV